MTCGLAVKRPHDYEAYLSPESEAKRARPAACSPFRPHFGTLAASLPSNSNFQVNNGDNISESPFAQLPKGSQLSDGQLEDYLRAEVRYLKRRRLIPRRFNGQPSGESKPSTDYRRGGCSPSSSYSGSDSESEQSSRLHGNKAYRIDELYDRPQFSLNQVKLICERLLKEQETRLRYEYETVLNCKLEEKHQEYVQFAKEQLESRRTCVDLSYLS